MMLHFIISTLMTSWLFLQVLSNDKKLRIVFHNNDGKIADVFKNNLFEKAAADLKKLMSPVYPMRKNFTIDRDCVNNKFYVKDNLRICTEGCVVDQRCSDIKYPDFLFKNCYKMSEQEETVEIPEVKEKQVRSDVFIITEMRNCKEKLTIAISEPCLIEPVLSRPIVGTIILCENEIHKLSSEQLLNVIKHEIIHILGFSKSLFPYFQLSNRYGPQNSGIVRPVNRKLLTPYGHRNETLFSLILPTVLKEARRHFNCNRLNEIYLDTTSDGKFTSHFNLITFYNEVMVAKNNPEKDKYFRLSLALLKDSGWYNIDLSLIPDSPYGKQVGCLFLEQGFYAHILELRKSNTSPSRIYQFCPELISNSTHYCEPILQIKLDFLTLLKRGFISQSWVLPFNVNKFDYSSYGPILKKRQSATSSVIKKSLIFVCGQLFLYFVITYNFG